MGRRTNILTQKIERGEMALELLTLNLHRMMIVAPILFFMEIFVYLGSDKLMDTGYIILPFLISNLVTVPLLFISWKRIALNRLGLSQFSLCLYIATFLAFGIALTLHTVKSFDLVHVYLIFAMGISLFIYLNPLRHGILLGISLAVFLFFLPRFQDIPAQNAVTGSNAAISIFLSWLFGRVSLALMISNFRAKRALEIQNRRLVRMVRHDQMTDLLTHEASFETLSSEIEQALENEKPLALFLFDVDDFKQINEGFGHLSGDKVLIEVAKTIKQVVRPADQAGRYGGDEFLIIMPATTLGEAKPLVTELSDAIHRLDLLPGRKVTLSGGLVELRGESTIELIDHADKLLFQAKAQGKDQFIC